MKLSNKEMYEVNLVCAALKKAGVKFEKNDVSVLNGGFVRLSFKSSCDLKVDSILWELKQIGYKNASVDSNCDVSYGRRWFSIDTNTYEIECQPKREPVRYVSIDEVYCTVYIDF